MNSHLEHKIQKYINGVTRAYRMRISVLLQHGVDLSELIKKIDLDFDEISQQAIENENELKYLI